MTKYFAILDASERGDGDYVGVFDTLEEAVEFRKSYDLPGSVAVDVDTFSRLLDLARAVNKTGGVVVEYHGTGKDRRPLRDWITEYLNEVDGKVTK